MYFFFTFPYSILGKVWYLIVMISDICLLPYFDISCLLICTRVRPQDSSILCILKGICSHIPRVSPACFIDVGIGVYRVLKLIID